MDWFSIAGGNGDHGVPSLSSAVAVMRRVGYSGRLQARETEEVLSGLLALSYAVWEVSGTSLNRVLHTLVAFAYPNRD